MRVAGAILAGGKAERLAGAAKGLLRRPDGITIVEHLRDEMAAAGFGPLALCAGEHNCYDDCGMVVLVDRVAGSGPLAGIEAALSHFRREADAVAFAPCDTPRLTRTEFSILFDAFRAKRSSVLAATGQAWHPLCSIVHSELLPQITSALKQRRLAVHRLWKELGAVPVQFRDDSPFVNINTPADYSRLTGGRHAG